MFGPPALYDERRALRRLKIDRRELTELLAIGILAPVARDFAGPLYFAATIDRLSAPEERTRLADAVWWDFDLQRPRYVPSHLPWSRAMDLPFYPFDTEELQRRARRIYKLKKDCAPFPYPHRGRLERFKQRMEDKATRAFDKAYGIKRPRKSRRFWFHGVGKTVKLTRAELRDLVWSKTMIRAAADLGISEFTLRQRCREYSIPMPTRGHFNHKNPTDRPRKPALSPFRKARLPSGGP